MKRNSCSCHATENGRDNRRQRHLRRLLAFKDQSVQLAPVSYLAVSGGGATERSAAA